MIDFALRDYRSISLYFYMLGFYAAHRRPLFQPVEWRPCHMNMLSSDILLISHTV